ncbi:hypothetical protein AAFF_G00138110 [Aldrovandia affinis]|uniref:Uncharacterized protein n=1 Tax=Aldrovandia affinis TaxID=143900 RepID=A0AAD7TCI9_9TELE|nr:hypothetical protein AAFF_G00138110 [Aldrovandia affinis]
MNWVCKNANAKKKVCYSAQIPGQMQMNLEPNRVSVVSNQLDQSKLRTTQLTQQGAAHSKNPCPCPCQTLHLHLPLPLAHALPHHGALDLHGLWHIWACSP